MPPSNPTPQRSAAAATPINQEPSGKTPPLQDLMTRLQKQVYELSGAFGRMQLGMERLHTTVGHVSELSSRLMMLLAVMGGVPRSFAHGVVPMALWSGLGSGRGPGFGRGGGGGGGGGGFDKPYNPADVVRNRYLNQIQKTLFRMQFDGRIQLQEVKKLEDELMVQFDQGQTTTWPELKARFPNDWEKREQAKNKPQTKDETSKLNIGEQSAKSLEGKLRKMEQAAFFDIETPIAPNGLGIDWDNPEFIKHVHDSPIKQLSLRLHELKRDQYGWVSGTTEKGSFHETDIKPENEREVLQKFVKHLKGLGENAFPVAHNGKSFDFRYLIERMKALQFDKSQIDLMRKWQLKSVDSLQMARQLSPDAGNELGDLHQRFLKEGFNAHEADTDTAALAKVFVHLVNQIARQAIAAGQPHPDELLPPGVENAPPLTPIERTPEDVERDDEKAAKRAAKAKINLREIAAETSESLDKILRRVLKNAQRVSYEPNQPGYLGLNVPQGGSVEHKELDQLLYRLAGAFTWLRDQARKLNFEEIGEEADKLGRKLNRVKTVLSKTVGEGHPADIGVEELAKIQSRFVDLHKEIKEKTEPGPSTRKRKGSEGALSVMFPALGAGAMAGSMLVEALWGLQGRPENETDPQKAKDQTSGAVLGTMLTALAESVAPGLGATLALGAIAGGLQGAHLGDQKADQAESKNLVRDLAEYTFPDQKREREAKEAKTLADHLADVRKRLSDFRAGPTEQQQKDWLMGNPEVRTTAQIRHAYGHSIVTDQEVEQQARRERPELFPDQPKRDRSGPLKGMGLGLLGSGLGFAAGGPLGAVGATVLMGVFRQFRKPLEAAGQAALGFAKRMKPFLTPRPFHERHGMDQEAWDKLSWGEQQRAKLSSAARTSAGGLVLGTAAAGNALSAGAPDAFATLKGSIGLLAAQIGQSLIPLSVQLSGVFQNLAAWFRGLSEGTKENLVSVLKAAGGFALMVVAASKLVTVLGALGTAVVGAGSAIGLMGSTIGKLVKGDLKSIGKDGWGSLATGTVALIASFMALRHVVDSLFPVNRDLARDTFKREDEAITKQRGESVRYNDQEIKDLFLGRGELGKKWGSSKGQGLEAYARQTFGLPELSEGVLNNTSRYAVGPRSQAWKDSFGKLQEALARAEEGLVKSKKDLEQHVGTGRFGRILKGGFEVLTEGNVEGEDTKVKRVQQSAQEVRTAETALEVYSRAAKIFGDVDFKPTKATATEEERQALKGRRNQLLYQISSSTKATPQYSSIEESYKKIQLNALGQDPLSTARLVVELESQTKLLQELATVAKQLGDSKLEETALDMAKGLKNLPFSKR